MTLRKDRKRIAPDNKYIGITMMKSDLVLKDLSNGSMEFQGQVRYKKTVLDEI